MRTRLAAWWHALFASHRALRTASIAAFVLATGATYAIDRVSPVASLGAWLYLPFVLLVTLRWGLQAGVGAAAASDLLILGIAALPFGTLTISDPFEYLRLAVAAVGLLVATLFVGFLHQRGLDAERAAAAQAERAEALEARDAFLAAISHDLRTPLTALQAGTQLLRRLVRHLDAPQQERVTLPLTEMDRAVRAMGRMLDDLLDLSRLESGRPLRLHRERLDLVALARQVVAEQQRSAPHHRVLLVTTLDELVGSWSPSQVERVLVNLLANAVKYSPAGRTVTVVITANGATDSGTGWAELRVQDEGIGIPAADLPHVFERFHRARNVVAQTQGWGIGLAGVKQMVEQHGGTLAVASEQGRGSVFTVRLPREPSDTTSSEAAR